MGKDRKDPFGGLRFKVEIDGITEAHFFECTGLRSETEVVEYQEGGENTYVHRLPGQTRFHNIVLKHGVTDSKTLIEWRQKFVDGTDFSRKNGSIILLNDAGEEVRRWSFKNGWPAKWEGPDLRSNESRLAIELLEIAHEGITEAE